MQQIVKYQSPTPSSIALIDISPTVPIAPIIYSTPIDAPPHACILTPDATPGTKTVTGQDSIAFTLGKICGGLAIAIVLVLLGMIIAKLNSPAPVAPSVIVVQPEPPPIPATPPPRSSCLVLCSGN